MGDVMGDIFDDARPLVDKWKAEANQKKRSSRMDERFTLRCHPRLVAAIERAADKKFMSASEYVRQAVLERLKADKN